MRSFLLLILIGQMPATNISMECKDVIDYVDASPASLGCGDCIVERVVKVCNL